MGEAEIQYVDLLRQYQSRKSEIDDAIVRAVGCRDYILGDDTDSSAGSVSRLGYSPESLPNGEAIAPRILSLRMFLELIEEEMQRVATVCPRAAQ